MCARVVAFHSRASVALALCALLAGACGDDGQSYVTVSASDSGMPGMGAEDGDQGGGSDPTRSPCDRVELDGEIAIERERDFTARYRIGEPYDRTVMLFGGEAVEEANALSNAYIFGLDKQDALMLAAKYPDFYLCSSPGGQEASSFIISYDLVPASCEVYQQITSALQLYNANLAKGGDRTSLRIEGAPLELESVTADSNGTDVTDQVGAMNFHLVTAVEQLTGESVISFGTSP